MRIAVVGAGGPAGLNVCRSLSEAGYEVVGLDSNEWHLEWAKDWCAETILCDGLTVELVNGLGVEMIHSQPEQPLYWLAAHREQIWPITNMPAQQVIALCQDKFEAGLALRRAKLRTDRVLEVADALDLLRVADALGFPYWLRARRGAGARGAILAADHDQAYHWLCYWRARDPEMEFIAEEYLPGRDLAWSSLWHKGELVTSFVRERLEYIYPQLSPAGLTGTPTVARVIHDDFVNFIAEETVLAVDTQAQGFYSVDLKEDENGTPRPTEINAGRCFTTSYFSTAAGLNMMDLWVRAGLGQSLPEVPRTNALEDGLLWIRHIDAPARLVPAPVPA